MHAIIDLKEAFDKPIQEVRLGLALDICDNDCPNSTTLKLRITPPLTYKVIPYFAITVADVTVNYAYSDQLQHIFQYWRHLYRAIDSHQCVQNIDKALSTGDSYTLMEITKLNDLEALLSNEIETTHKQCTTVAKSQLLLPGIENHHLTKHIQLITELEKDYPELVCCSVSIRENL